MAQQETSSIIVKGDLHSVYALWADVERFPEFMEPIKSVEKTDSVMSHWIVEGPFGTVIEWDAVTTREEDDRRIAWTSNGRGDIKTSGQVTFMSLPHGETHITVTMKYQAQKTLAPAIFEQLFGDLKGQLNRSLRRFKVYAEHSGIVTPTNPSST